MRKATFDPYGRMQYHPEVHDRHGLPWSNGEVKYLIDRYAIDGPMETSLALGRTIHVTMTKAYELRKNGLMPKPVKQKKHSRKLEVERG